MEVTTHLEEAQGSLATRLLSWRVILIFWSLLSVLSSIPNLALFGWQSGAFYYPHHLAAHLISGLACVALTPLVLWMCQRFFLSGPLWWAKLLLHIAASAIFSTAVIALYVLSTKNLWSHPQMPLADQVTYMVSFFFHPKLTYYWIILLVHHLLAYVDRLHGERLSAAQAKQRLSEAQLKALRAKLHPHFLFNSLHTVGSLIQLDRGEEAADALEEIGDLLRDSLDRGSQELIQFDEELAFVRRYLNVETRRFHDRLSVIYEIAPEARKALVPALILQPLVENAIRHGAGGRKESTTLRIQAARVEGDLHLTVSDDGPGLRPDWSFDRCSRIGLKSTRDRLDELYPGALGLSLTNREPSGLTASLRFPYRTPCPA